MGSAELEGSRADSVDWVATQACRLPSAQRPVRVEEFDALFAQALRQVHRLSPTQLQLLLGGSRGLAERTRDLADRETGCCSFFTFTIEMLPAAPDHGSELLRVDIDVPAPYVEVLDALARRAQVACRAARGEP